LRVWWRNGVENCLHSKSTETEVDFDEKSTIISHFEDFKAEAEAEAKERYDRRKRELFDFEIGFTCDTSVYGSDSISEVEPKKSKQSTLYDYVDSKATDDYVDLKMQIKTQ
jgi:hypothetical protein